MSLLDQIKDLLEQLFENYKFSENMMGKLEELYEHIEKYQESLNRREPETIFFARLLAKFIESIGDRMPPVISDFIKLYAQALKSTIETTVYLACIRYWLMREMGASHEDAAYATQLTNENKVWCRLLWLLHHLPPADPDLESPPTDNGDTSELEPPQEDGEWLPNTPEPPKTFVHEDFKECCETGGKDEPIKIDWGTLKVQEDDGNGFLVGRFSFEHPCGIADHLIQLQIPPSIDNFFQIGTGNISTHLSISHPGDMIKVQIKKQIQLYNSDISLVRPRYLRILGISNCFTKPEVGFNELTITKPS